MTVTQTQRLTVVKHLAGGKSPDIVATITKIPRSEIVDIGAHHGYPDADKLKWAADILEKKVEDENSTAEITEGTQVPVVATRPPATPTPAPPAAGTESILALVNSGKAHPSKRIQSAANKVLDDLAKLRHLIADDESKHAERRKAAAEKVAARSEVERLKKQLAEAQAKLRGRPAPAPAKVGDESGPSAKDIRTWAAETGVECTAVGRVPASVREAYNAAHMQGAA